MKREYEIKYYDIGTKLQGDIFDNYNDTQKEYFKRLEQLENKELPEELLTTTRIIVMNNTTEEILFETAN